MQSKHDVIHVVACSIHDIREVSHNEYNTILDELKGSFKFNMTFFILSSGESVRLAAVDLHAEMDAIRKNQGKSVLALENFIKEFNALSSVAQKTGDPDETLKRELVTAKLVEISDQADRLLVQFDMVKKDIDQIAILFGGLGDRVNAAEQAAVELLGQEIAERLFGEPRAPRSSG